MKVNIKVKSPVHIGSGDKYGASEYIKGKGKFNKKIVDTIKRIDVSQYFLSLNDDDKDKFVKNLSVKSFNLKSIDSNLNNFKKYTAINKCNELKYNKEIFESIKTLNQLYIPGSSIKGAIKTAIFYHSLDFDDINNIIKFGNVDIWPAN